MKRSTIEETVLSSLKYIKPIEPDDIHRMNQTKCGRFGVSFLAHLLYANGHNLRCKSIDHPLGLLYDNGETVFSIGLFTKEEEPDGPYYVHISAPVGKLDTISSVVEDFLEKTKEKGVKGCYIRHLTKEQKKDFEKRGYQVITEQSNKKWHPIAYAEDETHNHRLVEIAQLVEGGYTGKFGQRVRRFEKFLASGDETNGTYELEIEEYTTDRITDAKSIITQHFRWLDDLRKAIGSTFEDYQSIIENIPDHPDIFAQIGYLKHGQTKTPVTLFIGERTGEKTAALYVCFALRLKADMLPKSRANDYAQGISPYAYLKIFEEMKAAGIQCVDIGGSETIELDNFKRRTLKAEQVPTFWVYKEAA